MTDRDQRIYEAISEGLSHMLHLKMISDVKYWDLHQELNKIYNVPANAYMNGCMFRTRPKRNLLRRIREKING